MRKIYDGYLLCGDSHAVADSGIGDMNAEPLDFAIALERLQLSLDSLIPREATGYVTDICSGLGTREMKLDRLTRLARYVEIVLPRSAAEIEADKKKSAWKNCVA